MLFILKLWKCKINSGSKNRSRIAFGNTNQIQQKLATYLKDVFASSLNHGTSMQFVDFDISLAFWRKIRISSSSAPLLSKSWTHFVSLEIERISCVLTGRKFKISSSSVLLLSKSQMSSVSSKNREDLVCSDWTKAQNFAIACSFILEMANAFRILQKLEGCYKLWFGESSEFHHCPFFYL